MLTLDRRALGAAYAAPADPQSRESEQRLAFFVVVLLVVAVLAFDLAGLGVKSAISKGLKEVVSTNSSPRH